MTFATRISVLAAVLILAGAEASAVEIASSAVDAPRATAAGPTLTTGAVSSGAQAVKPARSGTKSAALRFDPPPVPFSPSQHLLNWYEERASGPVVIPRNDRLIYCHGYDCTLRTAVALTRADFAQLEAIFATRRGSAVAEREGIDLAVQWWEKRAAPLLGGKPDIRGSEFSLSNQPGQTDCLDEATNSTTILIYLQQKELLRYHRVERPRSRGSVIYAHASAVFEEIGGKAWVVDSWMRDSGDPNDVMPESEWSAKW